MAISGIRKIGSGILILAGLLGLYSAWQLFGPTVKSPEGGYFYIPTGSQYADVQAGLKNQGILGNDFFFNLVAQRVAYPSKIKPGRYAIRGGNIVQLVRKLKSGNQDAVRLVINKYRTPEDMAGKMGRLFEADSLAIIQFLNNHDSLKPYGLDTHTVMTAIIPNSYLIWWDGPFQKIFSRLHKQQVQFWEGKRTEKAGQWGLTPLQVYILASIVEEETNKNDEKGKVASVYYNRLQKGMRLEADPTVKYALRDFGLKRILRGHLETPSPYNTYRNTGLPPGPICTPSIQTLEAVLNMPKTDYLFFAAKPEFNGYHNFAATYPEHLVNARAYRLALDSLIRSKSAKP